MLTVKKHRLSIILGTAIIGIIVLSILSNGILILPKNESIANDDLAPPTVNNTSSSQEINDTSSMNQVNYTLSNKPQIPIQDQSFPIELQNNSDIVNDTLTEQYTFKVTTDSGYSCTSGDPTQAIQNAINTLPNRTTPAKIMLQGQFDNVSNINLTDNIIFEGNNATLTATDHSKIFILQQNHNYSETYKTFSLNNASYTDWINLHNVTFSNINFKHNLQDSCSFAIYLYESNGTGWGISQNINVYNCTFTGFYSGFYILPINSSYSGNLFNNFTGNGFMLPYGADINITNNNFITPSSQQGAYPKIGLHLLDIEGTYCLVTNNTFSTDSNSAGLAVVSSTGDINITENLFIGNGTSCLIDFYTRPFPSSGVHVFSNTGLEDFSI
jgi:hypothetical protein